MTIEEQVLEMLTSASFEVWYETEFMDFVEGEKGAPSKQQVLEFIKSHVN
jgi:hypothetical protein